MRPLCDQAAAKRPQVRAAIYARVSTEAQEARGTIGSQLEALREHLAAEGHAPAGEFVDDGYSGARLDRPGLDALRDAAEAGLVDVVLCLTPDRLSRSYAYQVLISDELARHGAAVRYLDSPDIASDPQARLLTQVQSVIAEYERAKISERSRRGKLFRARAGEAVYWKAPFGYTRVPRQGDRPAHLVINEAQAAVVRRIFADYTTGGLSLRKITLALNAEGVTTPSGRRWITSTLGRVLRRETYVGRLWVNRTKTVPGRAPGARPREVPRAKEEWIAVPCPAIIDEATFAAAARACADNTNFSARRLNPDEEGWLLRGLVFCACGARSIVDRGGSSQPGGIHYYSCRNRQGIWTGHDRTCLARNVRADGLDDFVLGQVRAALSSPEVLLAGERAVAERQPAPDDELLAKELTRLGRRIEATTAERRRLADLYQAGVLGPDELAQRASDIEGRRSQLSAQRDQLLAQRRELASGNRLRQRLEGFASQVLAAFDDLDFHQRQRLMRLLVERVQVRGWEIDIHLRIPLDEPPPLHPAPAPIDGAPKGATCTEAAHPHRGQPGWSPVTGSVHGVSTEERLRSIG
ncbi:MAG: recombinase family protein, partial [Acidimicrobiales bacterium]